MFRIVLGTFFGRFEPKEKPSEINPPLKLLDLFKWMDINNSVHGLFHSAQFIEQHNNGRGLGLISEGGQGQVFMICFVFNYCRLFSI
jgi:hypothetical protein